MEQNVLLYSERFEKLREFTPLTLQFGLTARTSGEKSKKRHGRINV